MKVVHRNKEAGLSRVEQMREARELEADNHLEEAAKAYERILKWHEDNEEARDRLMIVYRKLREYKKELDTVNHGLSVFRELHSHKSHPNKKVNQLSLALLKATGLADKKGKHIYEPEPIGRWEKRRAVVLKKIKS